MRATLALTGLIYSERSLTDENFDLSRYLKNAFPTYFCFVLALYFNVLESELGQRLFDQI